MRSVGGCRRGSQGSGRQRAAKKAWSTETWGLVVWNRDWAVTSASRSSRVARVAPGWGSMPWNDSRGGEGRRSMVRVAEVMEGEARTAARETWPRAADASWRAEDWAARSWEERGKVSRAR